MGLIDIQAGRGGPVSALARAGLCVLSWGYGAGLALRGAFRRRPEPLPVPVISVGNIAAGGTGKTPFVIWLARRLRDAGRRPGILARGYGEAAAGGGGLNDEGAVIRLALGDDVPQVQDPDRVRGGKTLLERHPEVDVILLDDGFQHRRLGRDLDIVLLDATRPFGFGHLLPRGLLREPASALARAGAVVLTRSERVDRARADAIAEQVRGLTGAAPSRAAVRPASAALVEDLRGAPVLALCGIGNPDAFLGTLEDLGARVVARRVLRDHAALPPDGWPGVVAEARQAGAECVAITRKDAVKHERLPPEVTVVDVEMVVTEGEDALWARISSVFEG